MDYTIPKTLRPDVQTGWCAGCGHGVIIRMLAEAVEELGIEEKLLFVTDVACGSMVGRIIEWNNIGAAHGRPIITAAGAKRARPDEIVVASPGDGSAYSIGIESTIHCALRNENILALVVNNSVFGMTGGQMSPETLIGQKTTSSPHGRDNELFGNPLDIVKTLGEYDIAYLARGSVSSPANVVKTKKMIIKALKKQMNGEGFCLVEVLSPCPTNWYKSPVEAINFMHETQEKFFELGEFVDGRRSTDD